MYNLLDKDFALLFNCSFELKLNIGLYKIFFFKFKPLILLSSELFISKIGLFDIELLRIFIFEFEFFSIKYILL